MSWSLPALAIRRPVTMAMLVISLLGLGAIAWRLTPIEFLPRVDMPILACYIPYPGATPQQVDNEIAVPAGGEFKTLSGLERIRTYSGGSGCNVVMRFGWDTDMTLATADLRDRIERLKLSLPGEVERVFIRRYYSDQEPIIRFALFREEKQDELALAARRVLKNRLLRVDGVAEVEVSGRELPHVYVEFDQDALRSRGVDIYTVVSALQTSSISIGAGELVDGQKKYFVRTKGEFSSSEELANVLVAPGVRLKEIAQVTEHPPEGVASFAIDGKQGVFISIQKEAEANTVRTSDAIRAELEAITEDAAFRDVEVFVFDDQGEVVRFAIDTLLSAGKYGSILAFTVLLIALRRLGPTLIVALTTPTSMVAAVAFVYLTGRSLNLVTMSAMLVSIGMLVDNAIVVVENILRHNRLGPDRVENARRGASEVGLAITAATLTTVVVFIPVIYMESGELSLFMREFAGPMTTALIASLFLALTILPLAESRLSSDLPRWPVARLFQGRRLGPAFLQRALGRFRALEPLDWAKSVYHDLLALALQRRTVCLGFLAVLLSITYALPYQKVGMREMPTMDMRQVRIRFYADPNYGRDEVKQTAGFIQNIIDERREDLGIRHVYLDRWGTGAYFRLYLIKREELARGEEIRYTTDEVRDILSALLAGNVPGGRIDCGVARVSPKEDQTISVHLRGDDPNTLYRLADDFLLQMDNHPDLRDVKSDRDEEQEEIQIRIDEPKALAAGMSPLVIARTVNFALGGTRLPYLKRKGREIPVWAQLRGEDRETTTDLENVAVQGQGDAMMPLSDLVFLDKAPAARHLRREDGKITTGLIGKTNDEDLMHVSTELRALAAAFHPPTGYAISMGEQVREMDVNLKNFRGALILAVILIYLVMAALFESMLLPLSILTSVLLAFVGVYWSMYLTSTPMDTVSLIGSILMCGIIVNNGIVIIDHINQLRKEGVERQRAVRQAGLDRFRPVMMTSLTTILGTLPLAIGGGEAASALTSLGRAFVGGLSAGTILTLMVVPLAYTLVDDLQVWVRNFVGDVALMGKRFG